MLVFAVAFVLGGFALVAVAAAAKKLPPPLPGPWKITTETGGQVIGGFTVTKKLDVSGLKLKVPEQEHEEGDEDYCRGGTLSSPGGSAGLLPISHFAGSNGPFEAGAFDGWMVGASSGSIGGGSLEAAETVMEFDGFVLVDGHRSAFHESEPLTVEIVLTSRKGKRMGSSTTAAMNAASASSSSVADEEGWAFRSVVRGEARADQGR